MDPGAAPAAGSQPAAVIHIGVRRTVSQEDLAQYDMIADHPLGPGTYRDWRLPFALVTRLEEAAEAEGGYFRTLTSTETERIRGLVSGTDEAAPVEDLARDLVTPADGQHASAAVTGQIPAQAGPSGADGGPQQDHRSREARVVEHYERYPTLAVLSTPGDSYKDWVRAGMALARVLLTGLQHGVMASFLHAPVDILSERSQLRSAALGLDFPQLMVRLGYPQGGVTRTPRPAADQVTSTGRPGR